LREALTGWRTEYQRICFNPRGLSALLDDSAIAAVAVCVPAQFHVEVALAALDAEKHLFIEKPLALSLDESERLIERAAQSPRKVMIGFNLRWQRLVRQARAMIQQRTLGPLALVRTALTSYDENVPEWRKQRNLGGGVLFELAVHHFDLWRQSGRTRVAGHGAEPRSRCRELIDNLATDVPGAADDQNTIHTGPSCRANRREIKRGDQCDVDTASTSSALGIARAIHRRFGVMLRAPQGRLRYAGPPIQRRSLLSSSR